MWQHKPAMWAPGIRQGHPLATGLVGYWPMWEGGGTRLLDIASGIVGPLTFTTLPSTAWTKSETGACIDIGGNKYISTSTTNLATWTPSSGTIACDFTTDTVTGTHLLMEMSQTAANRIYIRLDADTLTLLSANFLRTTTVAIGVWYRLVYTWSPTSIALYLDGKFVSSASGTLTPLATSRTLILGSYVSPVNYFWDGKISHLGIWSKQFTASEVAEIYYDPFSLITPRARSYFYAATGAVSSKVPVIMSYLRRRRAA